MTTTMNPAEGRALEHQVADLSLAEWGRKEILLAEQEMPGLMAVRARVRGRAAARRASASRAACT